MIFDIARGSLTVAVPFCTGIKGMMQTATPERKYNIELEKKKKLPLCCTYVSMIDSMNTLRQSAKARK
jgi:hypothetical protein